MGKLIGYETCLLHVMDPNSYTSVPSEKFLKHDMFV